MLTQIPSQWSPVPFNLLEFQVRAMGKLMIHILFENEPVWSIVLLVVNMVLLTLTGWNMRGRRAELRRAEQAIQARQERILDLARENAAQRFEMNWLLSLSESTNDLNAIFELLKEAAGNTRDWRCWVLDATGGIIAEHQPDLRSCRIQLTEQGRHRLGRGSPACLSHARREFQVIQSGVDVIPHQLWACACGKDLASSPTLLLSGMPKVTGDENLDFALVARLCQELEKLFENGQRETDRAVAEDAALVKDMLQLRMLTDDDFASPEELLREFLGKLAFLTNFERASIYRQRVDAHAGVELMAAAGRVFPVAEECRCQDRELEWATAHLQGQSSMVWINRQPCGGGDPSLSSALLVRISHSQFPAGVLLLSSREEVVRSEYDAELAKWSAQFLPETFHRASTRAQIEDRARRDALTGLANRHVFDASLQACGLHGSTPCSGCSLMLLDLDYFKSINDQHGHLVGDEVLRCVAGIIQRCVHQSRITDQPTIARYGGEEFAILLPGVPLAGARRIAEQILNQLRAEAISVEGGQLRVTASIGVAGSPDHGSNPREWLQFADEALYAAKRSGRNRVAVAEPRAACQSFSLSGASA